MQSLRKFILFVFPLFLCLSIPSKGKAQQKEGSGKDSNLVQFSGVVVRNDSLTPIPFTNIVIAREQRGTMADAQGYFSLVAKENDTIYFSAVGYKQSHFVIPDTLDKTSYSLIHAMERDTVELKETTVYPWPTKEQFKEAFLNAKIPSDDIDRARKNLAQARMQKRMENMDMGPQLNFQQKMQEHQSKVYYAGQAPPMSILNPSAWAEFIKAWRNGRFTDQSEE
ncbi:MAG: carboxypeptidase-like regulatory domain-containing protein [Flavobacteriales bacterium]